LIFISIVLVFIVVFSFDFIIVIFWSGIRLILFIFSLSCILFVIFIVRKVGYRNQAVLLYYCCCWL